MGGKIALLIVAICLLNLLKIKSRADSSVALDTNINEEKSRKTNQQSSDCTITIVIYDHLRLDININEEKSMKTNQPGSDHSFNPYINFTEEELLKIIQRGSDHQISSDININIEIMKHRYNRKKYTCKYKCRLDLLDVKALAGCIFDLLPKYIGACGDALSWAVILYLAVASSMVISSIAGMAIIAPNNGLTNGIYTFIMFLIGFVGAFVLWQ